MGSLEWMVKAGSFKDWSDASPLEGGKESEAALAVEDSLQTLNR